MNVETSDGLGHSFLITFDEHRISISTKYDNDKIKWVLGLKVPRERIDRLPFTSVEHNMLNARFYSIDKIKQLLYVIAQMVPFSPNISQLSQQIGVSRNSLLSYIQFLERSHIIQTLEQRKGKPGKLTKPEKIYLHNTNYNYAFAMNHQPDKDNVRETFFCNQLKPITDLSFTSKTDFRVNDAYYFEVGGRNKGHEQISGLVRAYIAADNIELGFGNKIPL